MAAMDTRAGIVTDRLERVAGSSGSARRQQRRSSAAGAAHPDAETDTGPHGVGELVVLLVLANLVPRGGEMCQYDSLPFSTAGLRRVPGGATLRGPVEREDLDWHLARLSKRRAPGPDEVPYVRTINDSARGTQASTAGLPERRPCQWTATAGRLVRGPRPFPAQAGGRPSGAEQLQAGVPT